MSFKQRIKNQDNIYFFILNIITIIIFFPWLYNGHYMSDSYNIMNIGYKSYSINNSLSDARIAMFLVLRIADIINMNYDTFIKFTLFCAIIITNLSVYKLKKIFFKEITDWKKNCIYWILAYSIIYNFTYIDNLIFVECIVMAFGMLLSVSCLEILVAKNKYWLIKLIYLNIINVFCYQMMPLFFIVLTIAYECIYKDDFKEIIKNCFIVSIIVMFAICINFIFLSGIQKSNFDFNKAIVLERKNGIISEKISFKYIISNINVIKNYIFELIFFCDNIFFEYVFLFFVIIFDVILVYIFNKLGNIKKYTLKLLIISIGVFGITTGFLFISLYGIGVPRMKNGFGAFIGILALFAVYSMDGLNLKIKNIIYSLIIVYCFINLINYYIIVNDEIKLNELECAYVKEIDSYIKEYEANNNVKIEKIQLLRDYTGRLWFNETSRKSNIFFNSVVCSWSAVGVINYYTNRNLVRIYGEDIWENGEYYIINDILYIRVHNQ